MPLRAVAWGKIMPLDRVAQVLSLKIYTSLLRHEKIFKNVQIDELSSPLIDMVWPGGLQGTASSSAQELRIDHRGREHICLRSSPGGTWAAKAFTDNQQ